MSRFNREIVPSPTFSIGFERFGKIDDMNPNDIFVCSRGSSVARPEVFVNCREVVRTAHRTPHTPKETRETRSTKMWTRIPEISRG